jgi:hypothetical protein
MTKTYKHKKYKKHRGGDVDCNVDCEKLIFNNGLYKYCKFTNNKESVIRNYLQGIDNIAQNDEDKLLPKFEAAIIDGCSSTSSQYKTTSNPTTSESQPSDITTTSESQPSDITTTSESQPSDITTTFDPKTSESQPTKPKKKPPPKLDILAHNKYVERLERTKKNEKIEKYNNNLLDNKKFDITTPRYYGGTRNRSKSKKTKKRRKINKRRKTRKIKNV